MCRRHRRPHRVVVVVDVGHRGMAASCRHDTVAVVLQTLLDDTARLVEVEEANCHYTVVVDEDNHHLAVEEVVSSLYQSWRLVVAWSDQAYSCHSAAVVVRIRCLVFCGHHGLLGACSD